MTETGPTTATTTPSAAAQGAAEPGMGETAAGVADLPFDAALAELQGVVGRLEQGNLPLEESIALYERGVALHEHCARLLTDAELRVQRLVESAGGALRAARPHPRRRGRGLIRSKPSRRRSRGRLPTGLRRRPRTS